MVEHPHYIVFLINTQYDTSSKLFKMVEEINMCMCSQDPELQTDCKDLSPRSSHREGNYLQNQNIQRSN